MVGIVIPDQFEGAILLVKAIITTNLLMSSRFLDYVTAWLIVGIPRRLTFQDRNGRTLLSSEKAIPRQQPNLTFNNTANPAPIDIHCPNLEGVVGGLLDG